MADDIRQWLERLGLGKYCEVFAENEIDFDTLPRLDIEDLKELGLPIGPRKKLLAAIEAMDMVASGVVADKEANNAQITRVGEAERRQLTVMFCDLVGSTELSTRLDPEDYREVIRTYQDTCVGVIARYDGYVAKFMGDGVLVYFGYPFAQENEPERAVRAGLDLVEAVSALDEATQLNVRIGIATGPAVVGDIIGESTSEEAAVLGETPNLAARLQGVASPNAVLLSPATHLLLAGSVETEALAPVELKGFSQPIVPYRAIRARSLSEVSDIRIDQFPLVARDVELALLERAWRTAQSSEGQVVTLVGEPGVGKSRVVRAFQERVSDEVATSILLHCSPHYQTTANYPIIEQLRRALRFDEENAEQNLDRLEAMLDGLGLDVAGLSPVIALFLSIPTGDRYPSPDYAPEEFKRKAIAAQLEMLIAASERAPVLFVVEDLQWADPTTLEVLGQMLEVNRGNRILILMTTRPNFDPPWSQHSHATTHVLTHLNRHETAELVRRIAEGQGLSSDIIEQIVERTDGVPLYIEELTKTLLESTGESGVPASLQDSLMARLDRLGPTKELAQIASVIGRRFSLEALCTVAQQSRGAIQSGLQDLVRSGLAHRLTSHGEEEYEFKHALLRDAAYESILRERRRDLHHRAADVLRNDYPEVASQRPELVAYHYAAAEELRSAINLWAEAGHRSVQRFENAEAERHFRAALDTLHSLPPSPERAVEELELLLALGAPTLAKYGYAAPEVAELYETARALSNSLQDTESSFVAVRGLWHNLLERSELKEARGRAEELKALAEVTGRAELRAAAIRALGSTLFLIGDPRGCLEVLSEQVPTSHSTPRNVAVRYGDAPGIGIGLYRGASEILLGFCDTGSHRLDAVLKEAEAFGDPLALGFAYCFQAICAVYRNMPDAAVRYGEFALELAQDNDLISWEAHSYCTTGWAYAQGGAAQMGIERIRSGIDLWQQMGAQVMLPTWSTLLAEALLSSGDRDGALLEIETNLERWGSGDEANYRAETWRVKGDVLLGAGPTGSSGAEECYREAGRIAREQKTQLFQLRADLRLAKLLADRSKDQEAISVLTPVVGTFTEGSDEPDFQDAKALLDELS